VTLHALIPRLWRRSALFALFAVFLCAGSAALPQVLGESGLPIPRFVALRADKANLRAGPGTRYPVEWVYQRKGLPVEIIAEFDHWRRIRDIEGTVGWVHKSLLSGRRAVIVTGGIQTLYRSAETDATPLLRAEPGVIGELIACEGAWCRIEIADTRGWMERRFLWGVYPDETYPAR
jgi:SH3-like domain-containing protein